jgi:mono/diheme cytochrome c family protein
VKVNDHPTYRSEMRFREVWRDPRRLFGYTYPYFLVLLVTLGSLYVKHLTDIGKNAVTPVATADSSAIVLDIPYQTPQSIPPVDVKLVTLPTIELVARGREVYRPNCSSCHGDNGLGDGPAGAVLTPKPRNFHRVEGWTNGAKISAIYQTLQEGITRNGMPAFSYLSPQDRFALVHFVRSLNPAPPTDSESEIAQLETAYHLSKGSTLPGQVPIRVAASRLVKEAASRTEHVDLLARAGWTTGERDGARLLNKVIADPHRVFTAFPVDSLKNGNVSEFMHRVAANPAGVGFRPSVLQLTAEEWKTLFTLVAREVQ